MSAELVREFHRRQAELYAGGDPGPALELLSEDIVWHVPGRNLIAGEYRGKEEVLRYFLARRDAADRTFRIHVRAVLAEGDLVVQLAGGTAERGGRTWEWETLGVFRVRDGKIVEGRLVPFDQHAFDEIWS